MQIKDILASLRKDKVYTDWKNDNKDTFLAHVFKMSDEPNKDTWQVGFYEEKQDRMTTFVLENDAIKMIPHQEIFKKHDMHVRKIDEDKIKVDLDEALATADKLQQEKYKVHVPLKKIIILQTLDMGQVYNITFVTRSFNTLNIKVDSLSGEVVEEKVQSIVEFDKK